jgi:hypothetical protein
MPRYNTLRHPTSTRRVDVRGWATTTLVVALFAALGSAAVARGPGPRAQASSATGCNVTLPANATCTIPDLVALTGSQSWDTAGTHRVCAAARTSAGTLYADWECATGYAEHCYGGSNSLEAVIGSGDPNTYTGVGTATWAASCP